ncbi:MAG: HigA family addiction module antitoxin [Nocardioides sp.]|uniref:HigA family addiction module antitoxin n=1 Tax=Nocardioides sp. TaxID=35761 RepID=UPI0039E704EB
MTHWTTPGMVLKEDFLTPLRITQGRLAEATGLAPARIGEIVRGKASITPDVALRLARALDTSDRYWLSLQADYDLAVAAASLEEDLAAVEQLVDQSEPLRDAVGHQQFTHPHDVSLAMAVWLGRDSDRRMIKLISREQDVLLGIVMGLCDLVTLIARMTAHSDRRFRNHREVVREAAASRVPPLLDAGV